MQSRKPQVLHQNEMNCSNSSSLNVNRYSITIICSRHTVM